MCVGTVKPCSRRCSHPVTCARLSEAIGTRTGMFSVRFPSAMPKPGCRCCYNARLLLCCDMAAGVLCLVQAVQASQWTASVWLLLLPERQIAFGAVTSQLMCLVMCRLRRRCRCCSGSQRSWASCRRRSSARRCGCPCCWAGS